ncbi:MAG: hypothetical protein R3Y60_00300 [bacterium]
MKQEFYSIVYYENKEEWILIMETALQRDYLCFKSKVKCMKMGKKIASENNIPIYIYDKNGDLIEKYYLKQ